METEAEKMEEQAQNIMGLKREHMAILLIVSGTTCNTLGYVFANEHRFHPVTTNLIRGLASVLISYLLGLKFKVDLTFPSPANFKLQFYRNCLMIAQMITYAWSQFYLPLPIAITLQATSPIFATIFDRVLNKVDINCRQAGWLAVAFVGVLLTANGNQIYYLMTGKEAEALSKFQNYFSTDPMATLWAALILLGAMCCHAYAVVMTKRLTNTNCLHINYSQGVMLIMINGLLLPSAFSSEDYHSPSLWQSGVALILMGTPITLGLLAFAAALLMSSNYALLTPFMFTSIIFGYVVSIVRYNEEVNFICLLGAVAIVLGIIFIVRNKSK